MKGKIDGNGQLLIKRGEKYEIQLCPFAHIHMSDEIDGQLMYCGDWCPLFGEPEYQVNSEYYYESLEARKNVPKSAKLNLCKKELHFEDFVDERDFIVAEVL
ncbi:MAG: hypothetical protein GXZ03_07205 [Proteiniphilum sp.]|nr:hypothetical protein [Proteiniphilum sp.]